MASSELTLLLHAARDGDRDAADRLFAVLYADLKRLAHAQLGRARGYNNGDSTLATTALVHETYLRLVEPAGLAAEDRAHFFNLAARVMRHVVIDFARRRGSAKRGAALRVTWPEGFEPPMQDRQAGPSVLALDQALDRLENESPRLAQLVQLRFFGGLPLAEIAVLLNVSDRTLKRDWRKARAFLLAELG
jgi:RNA polymerase sigma factor (TIGR02999 family)